MKCRAVGAHRWCWQPSPGEVTQKGSGIPRLWGAWPWCPSVVETALCQRGDGLWTSTQGRSLLEGGGAGKWGCQHCLRLGAGILIKWWFCQHVPVEGDGAGLCGRWCSKNKTMSRFMGLFGGKLPLADSELTFGLWGLWDNKATGS